MYLHHHQGSGGRKRRIIYTLCNQRAIVSNGIKDIRAKSDVSLHLLFIGISL